MKVVIFGASGQLGRCLAPGWPHAQVSLFPREVVDVSDLNSVRSAITSEQPDVVINAAAMTDVDGCARNPDAAFRVNALGTQRVALTCQRTNAVMLYISTNEVFPGDSPTPYRETDEPRAINPYGASKLAGERYVQMLLNRFYIVRTAWLYSPTNPNNFPAKIAAAARNKNTLAVVDDELGNPTYADDLAHAIASLLETSHFGIYHLVGQGVASRYDWAEKVLQHCGPAGVNLTRTKLADYARASTPPRNGALVNFAAAELGITLRPWPEALEDYFKALDGIAPAE